MTTSRHAKLLADLAELTQVAQSRGRFVGN